MKTTTISSKGQIVIPRKMRESAAIQNGDIFDISFYKGLIVLRKIEPLDSKEIERLLTAKLPPETAQARRDIGNAIKAVRARRTRK
jgi:AbrB family looped-hinge helix DNA binding protein